MCCCDAPVFYRESYPRSQKVQKCCECFVEIPAFEKHWSIFGKWHDEVDSYRMCLKCSELFQFMQKTADCSCDVCFTQLEEWVSETRCDGLSEQEESMYREFIDRRKGSRK